MPLIFAPANPDPCHRRTPKLPPHAFYGIGSGLARLPRCGDLRRHANFACDTTAHSYSLTMLGCPRKTGNAAAWHRIFRMVRFLRYEGLSRKTSTYDRVLIVLKNVERNPPWHRIRLRRAQQRAKPLRRTRRKPARKWLRNWLTGLLYGQALPDSFPCHSLTSLQ